MHILHTESSCGWGGQEIRILSEARGLSQRGHTVTLLCPAQSTIYRAAPDYGLTVYALDIEKKSLKALWRMRQWLAANMQRFDVINTHSSTDAWLVALALRTLPQPIAVLRTRHVSSPISRNAPTYWLYQKSVQHLVVTGEPLRQQLAQHNQFTLASMTSIPTGIDLTRFYPRDRTLIKKQLGLSGTVIGILATLRNWKGHVYLLEAFQQLVKQQTALTLLIVGDGPQYQNLLQKIKSLDLEEHVRLVGNQENPEVWLNGMDIFVLPSYGDEGVSQAVMQAMASQLPVITTAVGGMTDAVQHEKTGLIVPIRDAKALADSIAFLLSHPEIAEGLAKQAYKRAQQYFGMEHMLDRMEAVFTNIVQERKVN